MSEFAKWGTFCEIVGSAAGALIGLQFVVMTLIANRPFLGAPEAGAAFATPTIFHFGAVLLVSALLQAPWPTIHAASTAWGLVGIAGFVYTAIVARRMRQQDVYKPEFEDWLFHAALPLLAYAILMLSPFAAPSHISGALFAVAGAVLLLLFLSIHNAWDGIAYHVFVSMRRDMERRQKEVAGKENP